MYPLTSFLALKVLDEERVRQADEFYHRAPIVQTHRPVVRSLALTTGRAFIALGNRLEHLGQ